jgi:hypothetical protein
MAIGSAAGDHCRNDNNLQRSILIFIEFSIGTMSPNFSYLPSAGASQDVERREAAVLIARVGRITASVMRRMRSGYR